MAEGLEDAVSNRANIRGESHTEQIEGINRAGGMVETQEIDAPLASAF